MNALNAKKHRKKGEAKMQNLLGMQKIHKCNEIKNCKNAQNAQM